MVGVVSGPKAGLALGALIVLAASLCWVMPAAAEACADPLKPMLRAELFFGRTVGDRFGVTDRLWQMYVDRELTPRFPEGFTVVDGKGQWREGDAVLREASKIVTVVAADSAEVRTRIATAMNAYIKQFRQKSVGLVTQAVCAVF
jgi:hypothetical protein